MRKSTGKAKILRTWYGEIHIQKSRTGETHSAKERNMEVFSDDFATVYFREKLCYDDLTEYGAISEVIWETFIG